MAESLATTETSKAEARSFEESLEALHQIVAQLEMGSLPLDETIDKFKEGSLLAAECLRKIQEAELRVTELSMGPSTEPTDPGRHDD
jgi:exodeoxyribonuclease VII small subunit